MGYILRSIFRKFILLKALAKIFLHFYLIYSYIYINQKLSFSKMSVKNWIVYPQNSDVEAQIIECENIIWDDLETT